MRVAPSGRNVVSKLQGDRNCGVHSMPIRHSGSRAKKVVQRRRTHTVHTVVFNDKLKHWGFRPLACAPYRARTKGKTENGVGYVKRNAIAGRAFPRWKPLGCILRLGRGRSPDLRQHGTTAEPPIERFRRVQAQALKPIEAALPSCR